MATFNVFNFGCRASYADGAALKGQLLQAGLQEVPRAEPCDVAVLNTCTVTATADAEIRQVIRRIHRANPRCRILVTGCYAQRAPQEIAELPGVAWVIGNSHKHAVVELLKAPIERRAAGSVKSRNVADPKAAPDGLDQRLVQITGTTSRAEVWVGEISHEFHFTPVFVDDRTRPTLKIQDGCDARCSFCIIPQVRGGSRSLTPDRVIDQVRHLESQGYQEIVLSGINLGGYGRDLGRSITFLGLLERILAETSIARLRISSIEPMDVTAELIRLAAREPRLAEHFHVPLQSGCDRILRLMNRRYWTTQYAERLQAIREQIPNCAIGADVMVGFPGETDEDHAQSLGFIAALPLTYVHVFPYSLRPNTAAAALPSQVNGRIAHERGQEIRSLVAQKHQAFLAAQVGRRLSVLTLDEYRHGGALKPRDLEPGDANPEETPARVALSSNYLKVVLPESNVPRNTLLDVWVRRVAEGLLYGHAKDLCPPEERAVSSTSQTRCSSGAASTCGTLVHLSHSVALAGSIK